MHVYGSRAQPGVLERWPAPSVPVGRVTMPKPVTWAAPKIATRVEMPPPAIWAAPDPELLLSITIAPLRFVPVSWSPPEVIISPWGPPPLVTDDEVASTAAASSARFARPRAVAYGLAAAAVAVGTFAVVVLR
ncbi:MAG: hypothetical protein ABWZ99_05820 [Ilumatobacteraceae bacterium]